MLSSIGSYSSELTLRRNGLAPRSDKRTRSSPRYHRSSPGCRGARRAPVRATVGGSTRPATTLGLSSSSVRLLAGRGGRRSRPGVAPPALSTGRERPTPALCDAGPLLLPLRGIIAGRSGLHEAVQTTGRVVADCAVTLSATARAARLSS